MARRTIIEQHDSSSGNVDDSGPAMGLIVGILVGVLAVVLVVLFMNGTFDNSNDPSPGNGTTTGDGTTGGGNPAPSQSSTEPSATATP